MRCHALAGRDQSEDGLVGHLFDGLPDGRELRRGEVCFFRAVEADDGHVVGHAEAELVEGAKCADGLHVRTREQGRRGHGGVEQPHGRVVTAASGEGSPYEGAVGEAGRPGGVEPALLAGFDRVAGMADDQSDACVAVFDQVLDPGPGPGPGVDADRLETLAGFERVQEYGGHPECREVDDGSPVLDRAEDDAVDLS